jgi:hypothetical protein
VWVGVSLWLGSDAGLSVIAILITIYGGTAFVVLWLTLVGWKVFRKSSLQVCWLEPIAVALVLAVVATGMAFQLRFRLSRSSLERYVHVVARTGVSHRRPVRVGLFYIRETEVLSHDIVRLITTACMFDDCGVVFSSSEPPRLGEDMYKSIGNGWWLWRRSW